VVREEAHAGSRTVGAWLETERGAARPSASLVRAWKPKRGRRVSRKGSIGSWLEIGRRRGAARPSASLARAWKPKRGRWVSRKRSIGLEGGSPPKRITSSCLETEKGTVG